MKFFFFQTQENSPFSCPCTNMLKKTSSKCYLRWLQRLDVLHSCRRADDNIIIVFTDTIRGHGLCECREYRQVPPAPGAQRPPSTAFSGGAALGVSGDVRVDHGRMGRTAKRGAVIRHRSMRTQTRRRALRRRRLRPVTPFSLPPPPPRTSCRETVTGSCWRTSEGGRRARRDLVRRRPRAVVGVGPRSWLGRSGRRGRRGRRRRRTLSRRRRRLGQDAFACLDMPVQMSLPSLLAGVRLRGHVARCVYDFG